MLWSRHQSLGIYSMTSQYLKIFILISFQRKLLLGPRIYEFETSGSRVQLYVRTVQR